MSVLFFILFLIALISIPVGLIKPRLLRMETRPKAFFLSSVATLVFLVLGIMAAPATDTADQAEEAVGEEEDIEVDTEPAEEEIDEPVEEVEESTEEATEATEDKEVTEEIVEEPEETLSQKNAVAMARDYLDYTAFSKSGLIDQLEYEGFDNEDATYAVENIEVDWQEQAVLMAESYLDYSSFSRSGLIEQLEYEGFSNEHATYAVDQVGL